MANLMKKLESTVVPDKKSQELLGRIIRREFDATPSNETASELLLLAYKYQVPQLDEMMKDFRFHDFKTMF